MWRAIQSPAATPETRRRLGDRTVPNDSRVKFAVAALSMVLTLAGGSSYATPVNLSPAQERAMGLRTAVTAVASVAPLASLPATVSPAMNGRVVVAVPFPGLVLRVDVLEGAEVRAGQGLAVLFSQQALQAGSELAQASAELKAAQAAEARTRTLAREGIIAGARAEEASARASQARAVAAEKSRLLAAAGGRGARAGEYVLRSPIAGRVAQLNLAPGAGVDSMTAAAVIDRTDKLWVEARIPAALAAQVSVGAVVEADGARGRVVAVGSAVDPRTRSVVLRAELPPGAGPMPGRTIHVTVYGKAPSGAVAAPRSAVVTLDGRPSVFVRTAKGFDARPVTIVGQSGTTAVITGLSPGVQVVAVGASQLKPAAAR